MFSSLEHSLSWAHEVLDIRCATYPPADAQGLEAFCVVERTGGPLDYPHDSPDMTFQLWARDEATAEENANVLAIAAKKRPMGDPHVNAMGVPEMMSYGRMEGGWFVWQVSVPLNVNLLD